MSRKHTVILFSLCLFLVPQSVQAEVITVDVTVKAIDATSRTITVTKTTKMKSKDIDLEVGKKAKILVGGKDAAIDSIKPGMKVSVSYETELEVVTKIDAPEGVSVSEEEAEDAILKMLKGTWLASGEEFDGKQIKKAEMLTKKKTLKVDGDKFTMSTSYYKITGKIKCVPDEAPNAIDLVGKYVGKENNGKAIHLHGIVEMKGQTLRLCYVHKGSKRPTEFETEEGQKNIFVIFERTE